MAGGEPVRHREQLALVSIAHFRNARASACRLMSFAWQCAPGGSTGYRFSHLRL